MRVRVRAEVRVKVRVGFGVRIRIVGERAEQPEDEEPASAGALAVLVRGDDVAVVEHLRLVEVTKGAAVVLPRARLRRVPQ